MNYNGYYFDYIVLNLGSRWFS